MGGGGMGSLEHAVNKTATTTIRGNFHIKTGIMA